MILAPLVSILLGYALNQIPPEIITERQFYKEDRFFLRSAIQSACEHVVSTVGALVNKVTPIRHALLNRISGVWSPVSEQPQPEVKHKGKDKGKGKQKGGKVGAARGTVTRLWTRDELAEYDGSQPDKGPHLALLGEVFDVSPGRQHYGPGGGYAFFSGRDGSRAYVSGDFTPQGLTDDVAGLSGQDYIGLDDWLQFYRKDYQPAGRLVGRYYDEAGRETQYYAQWQRWLAEARAHQQRDDDVRKLFPPCNSEWAEKVGGRVYCTRKSGGVKRDWVGVPREFFSGGKKRCACVRERGAPSYGADQGADRGDLDNPQLKEYPGCDPRADQCRIKP